MIKTQIEIDTMMALPEADRPAGSAWWTTQEMADARKARESADAKRMSDARKAREAANMAANAANKKIFRGAGYCNKCQSYCHGDCQS